MIAYIAIVATALAGLAGVGPWAIAAGAVALASLSQSRYANIYKRARESGVSEVIDNVMLRSFANSLVASIAGYSIGWLLRLS